MLGRVIAHLRGLFSKTGGNTASSTLLAGPVCPEPTTPTGNPCSAETTSPQFQPANPPASVSSEAAPPTTVGSSSGKKTRSAATATPSKAAGTKPATPARPTRQRAKPAPKAKPVAAQPTPLEPLPASGKAPVPTLTEYLSGGSGKPKAAAPPTRQRAKPAQKPKSKPAKRATSAKKTTSGKASARTRTARPSGASGT